jgi:hypothetical protein
MIQIRMGSKPRRDVSCKKWKGKAKGPCQLFSMVTPIF